MRNKLSRYNLFIEHSKNEYLIFNTFSGGFIRISKKLFSEIIKNLNIEIANSNNDLNIKKALIAQNIIIDENINEEEFIRTSNFKWRNNPKVHSLAIVPNSDCDFKCIYCFTAVQYNFK
jgi:uncharacterized protein